MKMKRLLLVVLSLLLLMAFGCSHDTNNSSVTNPNTNPFTPKGNVAGVLTDTVTSEPIVGAVIHIYDKTAVTGTDGAFVIKDVPANSPVDPLNSLTDEPYPLPQDYYNVTIDMSKVNVARKAKDANATLYPSYTYRDVTVKYSSLGESLILGENATNHDTPVNGFVANMDVHIAKLESSVTIEVVDCYTNQPVVGASVTLRSAVHSNTSSTGNPGNPVQDPKLTGAGGLVTFTNVEAMQAFFAVATFNGKDGQLAVVSLDRLNNQVYSTTDLGALCLESDDSIRPWITETTPASGADIALPTNKIATVVFKFSEDILGASVTPDANYYAGRTKATTSYVNGIFADIHVYYEGSKAADPEINKTVAWTDAKTLAVSFNALDASRYSVVLVKNPLLQDLAKNPVNMGQVYTVTFTTAGDVDMTGTIKLEQGKIEGGSFEYLSWNFIPNAYDYNVCFQKMSSTGVQLDMFCFATSNTHLDAAALALDYSNGYTYKVTVVARSAAGKESAPSNTLVLVKTLSAITNFQRVEVNGCFTNKFNWDAYDQAYGYQIKVDQYIGDTLYDESYYTTATNISEYTFPYNGWISNYGNPWITGELPITYRVSVRALILGGQMSPWQDFLGQIMVSATGCDIDLLSLLPKPTGLNRVSSSSLWRWDAYIPVPDHYEVNVTRYVNHVATACSATTDSDIAQMLFPDTPGSWYNDGVCGGNGDFIESAGVVEYKLKVRAIFADHTYTLWSDEYTYSDPTKPAFASLEVNPTLYSGDILEPGTMKYFDAFSTNPGCLRSATAPSGPSWLFQCDKPTPAWPAGVLTYYGNQVNVLIAINFANNLPMVKADVENVALWHIGRTVDSATDGTFKFWATAVDPTIATDPLIVYKVRYDEYHNRAMLYLNYKQGLTGFGYKFDFGHNTFTFSGKDMLGRLMSINPDYDTVTGSNYVY